MANRLNGDAPQLTWTNIVATVMIILTAAGGSYALVQQQFGAMERQFANATRDNANAIDEIKKSIERLRNGSIERPEHTELVKRMDESHRIVIDQLRVLETTRPTTGELQQVQTTTTKSIEEIKERVRSIEDYMRRPQPLAPITQPSVLPHQ